VEDLGGARRALLLHTSKFHSVWVCTGVCTGVCIGVCIRVVCIGVCIGVDVQWGVCILYAHLHTMKLGGMHAPLKVLITLVRSSGRAAASGFTTVSGRRK